MPSVKSVQLMARVIYEDGVVAMAQCETDATDPLAMQPAGPSRKWLTTIVEDQAEALRNHIREVGPEGLYQQAVAEAAARREQINVQADEADGHMQQGLRMGPRRRTQDDGVASAPVGEQGADELPGDGK